MIDIYDNEVPLNDMYRFYEFMRSSKFFANGRDTGYSGTSGEQLFSSYSIEDVRNLGFQNLSIYRTLQDKYYLDERKLKQIRVNLTIPTEDNRVHTDGKGLTLLYYANVEWDIAWGGHTLFLDHTGQTVEQTVLFKPGRIVVFDGTLPHLILTQSARCPIHRYTYVMQYESL